ncbi:MAG: hypothetical protein RUDDFDWM_001110 [Candidatus Fervidibacterota bacterium]
MMQPKSTGKLLSLFQLCGFLFLSLLLYVTLNSLNAYLNKSNTDMERLTEMLLMRYESLQRNIAQALSPGTARAAAKELGMSRITITDCEFVQLPTKPKTGISSVPKRHEATVIASVGASH